MWLLLRHTRHPALEILMNSFRIALPMLVLTSGLLSGCTSSAWYESVRQAAINQCDKQAPGASRDCLSKVSNQSYDSYSKERSAK